MGDVRFDAALERIVQADDRASAIRDLGDASLVAALAAASRGQDPLLANVLATELQNRLADKNAMIANIGEAIFRVDRDGRVQFVNERGATMLGMPASALIGRDLHDQVHVDRWGMPLPRLECPVHTALRRGQQTRSDAEYLRLHSGGFLPVRFTATPILRDGEVDGAIVVAADVSGRVRAEDALRTSEERYRELFQEAPHPYLEVARDGTILAANRAAHALVRAPEGSLPGRHVIDLHATDDAALERAEVLLERFRNGEELVDERIRMLRDDGVPIWVSLWVKGLKNEQGIVERSHNMVLDVTLQVTQERELQDMAEFASLNPAPVLRLSPSGIVVMANPSAHAFFAMDPVGLDWAQVCPECDGEAIRDLAANGGSLDGEIGYKGQRLRLTYCGAPRAGAVYVYAFDRENGPAPPTPRVLMRTHPGENG